MVAIRRYRSERNLTQSELAAKLGVTASAVTQWESGARNPSIIMLKKIAYVLGVSVDALVETATEETCDVN